MDMTAEIVLRLCFQNVFTEFLVTEVPALVVTLRGCTEFIKIGSIMGYQYVKVIGYMFVVLVKIIPTESPSWKWFAIWATEYSSLSR